MKSDESRMQQAVMTWWQHAHAGLYCPEALLFAIPNGGARHIITAVRMKREGVRAGVPDLFLAAPNKTSYGLFLEMKAGKAGRVSPAQDEMQKILSAHGYAVAVCRSFDEAKTTIEEYLTK